MKIKDAIIGAFIVASFLLGSTTTTATPLKNVQKKRAPSQYLSLKARKVQKKSGKQFQRVKKAPKNVKTKKESIAPTSIEFEKIFEISADKNASPRGFINTVRSDRKFWVADEKLAFIVTYFGANNTSTYELRYDGKILPIGSIEPPKDYVDIRIGVPVGGKTVSVKTEVKNISSGDRQRTYVLLVDGKEYAKGNGTITEIVDYKGAPAYILHSPNIVTPSRKAVVMYQGQAVSKEYSTIFNLKVISGALAYLAQKNTPNFNLEPSLREPPLFVLVWDGKVYGTQYDTVTRYIDSAGMPAYVAANYVHKDGLIKPTDAQFLVRGDTVVFSGNQGEVIGYERVWVDVNGNPAITVRSPNTNTLYVYYVGKKFFEGYDVVYDMLNVNGKLVVLVGKDRTQYVFIEK